MSPPGRERGEKKWKGPRGGNKSRKAWSAEGFVFKRGSGGFKDEIRAKLNEMKSKRPVTVIRYDTWVRRVGPPYSSLSWAREAVLVCDKARTC